MKSEVMREREREREKIVGGRREAVAGLPSLYKMTRNIKRGDPGES